MKPVATLLLSFALTSAASATMAAESTHDRAYWRGIAAHDFAVPAGSSAADLATELAGQVASTDPELRDDFGYEILARWIQRGALTPATLDMLRQRYVSSASNQLGSAESDAVFGRSFSLLALKELAAADLKTPFLTQTSFDELFDLAATSLGLERDLRGFVEGKGWAHATAHAADLMKNLARNPKLTATQQGRMIDSITERARSANLVFAWGEDSRLAAAFATLLQRPDAATARLEAWRAAMLEQHRALWNGPFDPAAYRRLRAQVNLLTALCAIIAPLENPGLPAELRTALFTTRAKLN